MTNRFVHEPEDLRTANRAQAEVVRQNLDRQGIAYMSVGLAALQYVLQEGNRNDWFDSKAFPLAAILAVAGIVAFVVTSSGSSPPRTRRGAECAARGCRARSAPA